MNERLDRSRNPALIQIRLYPLPSLDSIVVPHPMPFLMPVPMMLKTLRFLSIPTCLGVLLGGLAACAPSGPSSVQSGDQVLEFWTMQLQPEFTDYFNERIDAYEAAHPEVEVRWVDVPWSAMESKILTAVSAGTAPDVVNLNPNFATQLAERNAWLELDTYVPDKVREQYLPKIWQANRLGDKSFGIPWYLTTPVTIYNKTLLQQAGLSQPPQTYAELAQMAAVIKQKTGKYAFFITVVPDDSAELLESLVQMGVELVDGQGKAGFDTPQGRAAFQYWVDLYQKDLLPRSVLTQGHRHGIELYQAGEVAFLATGAEFLQTIQKNAPSIAQVSAIAPQVTGATGKRSVAVMNLVIPQGTDQRESALDFAQFITNAENQLSFAKAANVLPSAVEAIASYQKELRAESSLSALEQGRLVGAQQLDKAEVLVPVVSGMQELQKILYDQLQAAMLEEKTVDRAIADAAQLWNGKSPTPGKPEASKP